MHKKLYIYYFLFVLLIILTLFLILYKTSTTSYNVKIRDFSKQPLIISLYGDSLMSGYKVKKNETLYFNFAQKLSIRGIQNIVHNRSVAGDTSSKAFKRIKSVIADNPDIVILCLGANDMLQAIPPDIIYKNMESIILRFKEENTIIVLVGMLASRILNKKYISQFDSIFPDLAKKHDLIFMPFLLKDVAFKSNA